MQTDSLKQLKSIAFLSIFDRLFVISDQKNGNNQSADKKAINRNKAIECIEIRDGKKLNHAQFS